MPLIRWFDFFSSPRRCVYFLCVCVCVREKFGGEILLSGDNLFPSANKVFFGNRQLGAPMYQVLTR